MFRSRHLRSRAGLGLWVLSLLLASSSALGQDAGSSGQLTKMPALIHAVEAQYPEDALDAGQTARVLMELDLSATGEVTDARVVASGGAAFDAAAVQAARAFVFSPAEVDGAPSPVRIQYAYEFFLKPHVERLTVADAGVLAELGGRVIERGTRNPVAGALVVVGEAELLQEAVTDEQGNFQLQGLREGDITVRVSTAAHTTYEVKETLRAGERTQVTYYLRRKLYGAYETVVRAESEKKDVAQITLKQEEIRLIPGTAGDALRVVQNLPGVARTPFSFGLLVVRGSKGWDTRSYIDDVQIPQLFHFGGLYATFNSTVLEDIRFEAGNFGVEYGRAIAGLVRGQVRTPSQKGIHGYADVNVIDASALIEMPLNKNWSISASARRSYIDVVLPAVLNAFVPTAKDVLTFTVAPRYWDYQVRAEYRPAVGRFRFFTTVFGSDDQVRLVSPNPSLDPEGRGEIGTSIGYHRWLAGIDYRLADHTQFISRTSVGLDETRLSLGSDIYANVRLYPVSSRNTFITQVESWKMQFTYGLDLLLNPYETELQGPPLFKANQVPDPFLSRQLLSERERQVVVAPAVFIEGIWNPFKVLKVVAGLRADYVTYMNDLWLDPRVAVLLSPSESVTLKAAFGIYHQTPDFRTGALSKTFGNPNLKPEGSRQYMVGGDWKMTQAISLNVQLYYKELFDQARQTLADGDSSSPATDLRFTSNGRGRSFGAEILLRHQLTSRFFGWIAYSLSRAERDYRGGTVYGLAPLDQPHNLIVVASYKLPKDFIAGVRLRYTTGPLNTPNVSSIYDANGNYYYPIQGAPWSRRLPDFFQLDVRVDKRFVFRDWMLAIYLDIQNVTNRGNVEAVSYNFDYTQQMYLTGLPILPSLGVRAEW